MKITELFQENEAGTPREYNAEELQLMFVKQLYGTVDYWVGVTHYTNPNFRERLEGFTHSLYVTLNSSTGGDLYAYSTPEQVSEAKATNRNCFPEGKENAHRIDSDLMQGMCGIVPDPISAGPVSRQWTEEETTDLFRREVATRLDAALDLKETSELDKGLYFFHSILELIENGFPDALGTLRLVIRSSQEDKEYYIENGENYYPLSAPISGLGKSLLDAYAEIEAGFVPQFTR